MDDPNKLLSDSQWLIALGTVIAATLYFFVRKVFDWKSASERRSEYYEMFNSACQQLASQDKNQQLSAAVLLRRFYPYKIKGKKLLFKETIDVISAMLRVLPSNIFQKTLGDGLAYAKDLSYADLQKANMQDLYIGTKDRIPLSRWCWNRYVSYYFSLLKYLSTSFLERKRNPDSQKKAEPVDDFGKCYLKACYKSDRCCIKMDGTDMFESNLTEALIEYVNGYKAIFYGANMHYTQIKNSNLICADFRSADLTGAKFDKVILYGSNFTGAINIPKYIEDKLEDKEIGDKWFRIYADSAPVDYDGWTKTQPKVIPTESSDSLNKGIENPVVFFSMPGVLEKMDRYIINSYQKILQEKYHCQVKYYIPNHYPEYGQLSDVRKNIDESSAMIVFGFKQIRIDKGWLRPNLRESECYDEKWLPTPWNELEVGMGLMKGIPILLVKDDMIDTGVFDRHLSDSIVMTIPTSVDPEEIDNDKRFLKWKDAFIK